MGIYVKHMEMPEGCAMCYLKHECCDFKQHISSGNLVEYIDKRLDCCPLIEVKTPHGRLIDAGRIARNVEVVKSKRGPSVKLYLFIEDLMRILTESEAIIEAEGE